MARVAVWPPVGEGVGVRPVWVLAGEQPQGLVVVRAVALLLVPAVRPAPLLVPAAVLPVPPLPESAAAAS